MELLNWILKDKDPHQALRMRRYLFVMATSLLVVLLVATSIQMGFIDKNGGIISIALMVFLLGLFFILFQTGLNQKFKDPSLTSAQILVSCFILLFVMYWAIESRGVFSLILLVSFIFGIFRLPAHSLVLLSTLVFCGYMLMILLVYNFRPIYINLDLEILRGIVLGVVLYWFSVVAGHVSQLRKKLQDTNKQLEESLKVIGDLAIQDELTKISNRRHLLTLLDQEKKRSDRTKAPFCVCLIDIDHFKTVNDMYGHFMGDAVLKNFALLVHRAIRTTDYFGRYGGEEFLLVLTNTTAEGALIGIKRIREKLLKTQLAEIPRVITVSVGITQYRPQEKVTETIERADKAMYKAKQQRNSIVVDEFFFS